MKKNYQTPNTIMVKIAANSHLLAGSTGDISKVSISNTETISSGDAFGARGGSIWDDDEE